MKKFLCLILSILLLVGLCACGNNNTKEPENNTVVSEDNSVTENKETNETENTNETNKNNEETETEENDGEYKSSTYILYNMNNYVTDSSTVKFHFTNKKYGNSEILGDYSRMFKDENGEVIAIAMLYEEQYLSTANGQVDEILTDFEINSEYQWTVKKMSTPEKTVYRIFTTADNEETIFKFILQGSDPEVLKEIAECIVFEDWSNWKKS